MLFYLLTWIPMLLLAVANGLLREFFFRKFLEEGPAHQLSTGTLLLFFAFYIRWVTSVRPPASAGQAIWVGIGWLLLTLAFEFGFGRARGHSWDTLLADYNLLQGRLWVLIPLWVALAPWLFYRLSR
ncbi:MAG TPA: hypothetical protein VHK69_08460 [Chitinophagaceae bacterium]|nr:hypothetical protein [Chitinophagaceae bacterium]